MKVLGLDVGTKRIGIAKVDSSVRVSVPVGTVSVDGTEWSQIEHLANLNNTKFFVLGMPRSNEGNETEQSLYVRNFAKTLTEKIPGIKICFQDESLTSVEAEKRLKARKKKYEKGEIDAEAASIILQDFIENYSEKKTKVEKINPVKKGTEKVMLNSKKVAAKSKKLKTLITTPIVLVLLIIIAVGCVFWYNESLSPVIRKCTEDECNNIAITINEGDSTENVATSLKNAGIIQSAFFFKIYLKVNGLDQQVKTGTYSFNKGQGAREIANMLISGSRDSDVFNFTILPGETVADVKQKLLSIGYQTHEIEDAFNKRYDDTIMRDIPNDSNYSLEGYLFGETHQFYQDATVEEIIRKFENELEQVIEENDLENKFKEQGLTLREGIILASIVQKEAYPKDQPTVAQVFLSRLHLDMALGSDVTVTYALDKIDPYRTEYDNNYDALRVDSCYNTRKYSGLPCGPISNPSLSALLAVANPTDTGYLYFLTGDDDVMYYSYSASEHEKAAREHCKVLCSISL